MSQHKDDMFTPEGLGYTIPEIDLSDEDIEMLEKQGSEEYLDAGQILDRLSKADYDTDTFNSIRDAVKHSAEDRVVDLGELDDDNGESDLYKLFSKQDHTQISAREAIIKTENYLKIMNEEEHLLLQSRLTGVPLNTLLHGLDVGADDLEQLYDDDDLELLEQENLDPSIQYKDEEEDQVIQEVAEEIQTQREFIRDDSEDMDVDIIDSEDEDEDFEEIKDEEEAASSIVMSRIDLDKADINQNIEVEEIEEDDEVFIPLEDEVVEEEEGEEIIIPQEENDENKDEVIVEEDGNNIIMAVSDDLTIEDDDEELDESVDFEFDGAVITTKDTSSVDVGDDVIVEESGEDEITIATEEEDDEDNDSLGVADTDSLHVKKGSDNGSKTYSLKELNLEGGFD